MISYTLLTLVVVPAVYSLAMNGAEKFQTKKFLKQPIWPIGLLRTKKYALQATYILVCRACFVMC